MTIQKIREAMFALRESTVELESNEIREFAKEIKAENEDFEIGNYRFIHSNKINEIMTEELEDDNYILGCFNSCFLADHCSLPEEIIEIIQKAEAYGDLGQWLIDEGLVEDIAKDYADAEGCGDHFALYDGYTHDIADYYGFKING